MPPMLAKKGASVGGIALGCSWLSFTYRKKVGFLKIAE